MPNDYQTQIILMILANQIHIYNEIWLIKIIIMLICIQQWYNIKCYNLEVNNKMESE
jgi:hypothetical protein